MLGWEKPDKLVEISYFGGWFNPDDVTKYGTAINNWYEKEFNIRFKKECVNEDPSEQINLMLAGDTYPDVCQYLSRANAQKFATAKKAIDVSPYVDQYAPNLKEKMESFYTIIADDNGIRYYLYDWHGMGPDIESAVNLRYDWYLEAGSPTLETTEDLYQLLITVKGLHQKNAEGKNVYPLSSHKYMLNYQIFNMMWGITGGYFLIGADNTLTHFTQTDEGLQACLFANKLYREGLMDPDYFIASSDDLVAKAADERVFGCIGYYWSLDEAVASWKKTKSDYNENMRYVQFDVHAPNLEKSTMNGKNTLGGFFTVVTDKCDYLDVLFKFINFENSDMGSKLVWWGIPNEEYSYWNTDGKTWSFNENQKSLVLSESLELDEINAKVGNNVFSFTTPQYNKNDNTYLNIGDNFLTEDKWYQLRIKNMADSIFDASVFWNSYVPSDAPEAQAWTQVNELVNSIGRWL
jgi:ABC-type glycerol-3-phosphate transport system substrate-binding protein